MFATLHYQIGELAAYEEKIIGIKQGLHNRFVQNATGDRITVVFITFKDSNGDISYFIPSEKLLVIFS